MRLHAFEIALAQLKTIFKLYNIYQLIALFSNILIFGNTIFQIPMKKIITSISKAYF